MFQMPALAENSQKFQQIKQNSLNSPTDSVNDPFTVCFRCLTSGRELPKIPANQVKFAQFAHRSCQLRKFCAFHTKIDPHLVHFLQTSDPSTENPRKLE